MPPRPHMRDACKVGAYVEITVGGRPQEVWQYGAATRCRFSRNSTREVLDGAEVANSDVQVHLPDGVDITHAERIEITKRNGTAIAPGEIFEVIGDPWYTKGNREIVLACRSVPVGAV